MLPPPTTTPPGWYDDPWQPGGKRWWDGSTWAEKIPGTSASQSPQTQDIANANPSDRPFGWYADPDKPGTMSCWDGTNWYGPAQLPATFPTGSTRPTLKAKRRPFVTLLVGFSGVSCVAASGVHIQGDPILDVLIGVVLYVTGISLCVINLHQIKHLIKPVRLHTDHRGIHKHAVRDSGFLPWSAIHAVLVVEKRKLLAHDRTQKRTTVIALLYHTAVDRMLVDSLALERLGKATWFDDVRDEWTSLDGPENPDQLGKARGTSEIYGTPYPPRSSEIYDTPPVFDDSDGPGPADDHGVVARRGYLHIPLGDLVSIPEHLKAGTALYLDKLRQYYDGNPSTQPRPRQPQAISITVPADLDTPSPGLRMRRYARHARRLLAAILIIGFGIWWIPS